MITPALHELLAAYADEAERLGQAYAQVTPDELRRAAAGLVAQGPAAEPHAWAVSGSSRLYDEYDAKSEARRCGGTAEAFPLFRLLGRG